MRGALQAAPRAPRARRRPGSGPSSASGRRARCAARAASMPAARQLRLAARRSPSLGPGDHAAAPGALTAARDSRPPSSGAHLGLGRAARRAWRPAGSACISRPRAATSASASSSENTPARQAATYSPTLWPSIACGRDAPGHPQLRQRVLDGEERGLGRAPSAAALGRRLVVPAGKSSVAQVEAEVRAQELGAAVELRAEDRLARRRARAPCPAYCAPWPGNRNATGGRRAPRRRPATRRGAASAQRRARPRRASRHDHGAAVRERAGGPPGACRRRRPAAAPGARRRCAASSARRRVQRRRACAPRATSSCQRPRRRRRARGAGASSSTTCALVPPMPNELTPARRGVAVRRPVGAARSLTKNGLAAKSICGLGRSKCRLGGISPVLQREHGLDQPGDAGRRVEVADVGLDRADARRSRVASRAGAGRPG